MNFKSVTINLLLTTLSAGVLLQTLEAQAATITFGRWVSASTVIKNPVNSTFAKGNATANGNANALTLNAFAQADPTNDPLSGPISATTIISLRSLITVTPETGETNGDQVRAVLDGTLEGYYAKSGEDESGINFLTSVTARVQADGFEPWRSTRPIGLDELPPGTDPTNGPIVVPPGRLPMPESIFREGYLTIGETYALDMSLEVFASKTGRYQATSNFGGENGGLTVNIRAEPVPEPLTMLASSTALGFGAFLKRQHSKKPQKS